MTLHEDPLVSTPMRPLDAISAPVFNVPAAACDVHMHVFGPEDRFPHVAHPHYTLPDGQLHHYQGLMRLLHLQYFVIVQPSFYGTDNACLLDALGRAGGAARGVVMVEENISEEELLRFNALGVRALRLDLFKRAGEPLTAIKHYIEAMAGKIAPLGWHLQFYAPGKIVRDLLNFMRTLRIDFVIDHMGYMLEEDGLTQRDFARLLELLNSGHCWLKLSAPYRLAKHRGYEAVEDIAKAIVKTAPSRTLWGSDWPHIPGLDRDTGELFNLLERWTPDVDTLKLILSDNPRRLFRFT